MICDSKPLALPPHSTRIIRLSVALLAALLGASAPGCAEEEPPAPAPPVSVEWVSTGPDLLLDATWWTPPQVQRWLARPRLCTTGDLDGSAHILRVRRADRDLAPADAWTFFGDCVFLEAQGALEPPVAGGDLFVVDLEDRDARPHLVTLTMPAFPAPPESAFHAHAAVRQDDGTTWLATPHHGLLGVTTSGRVIHYQGIDSLASWDPMAREPQSGLVLDLARAGGRALWLSSATTGVSWFDPGPDPLSTADDEWAHGQPGGAPPLAAELAQTAVAIAPDASDSDGLWIASLNGLHHARRTADGQIDIARVADGTALSLTVDADGRVWVGLTTQVALEAPDEEDIAPGPTVPIARAVGALLVVEPGHDPHDPSAATLRWALADEDAVSAVLADVDRTNERVRGAWVGTPYGLGYVALDETLTLAPLPAEALALGDLAVVGLEATRGGFWLAARAECQQDVGRLLRVTIDDAGAIAEVADLSDAGFGERDFAWMHELPSGDLLVSTLVPKLSVLGDDEPLSARGCIPPPTTGQTADLYLLSPGGQVRRFGQEL